jgi:hypothetical protein
MTDKIDPDEENVQESQYEKNQRDFSKGFLVSVLWNSIVAFFLACNLVSYVHASDLSKLWIFGGLWLVVNLVIAIYLYWKNQKALQGFIAGYGVGFLLALIAGIILGKACFDFQNLEGW